MAAQRPLTYERGNETQLPARKCGTAFARPGLGFQLRRALSKQELGPGTMKLREDAARTGSEKSLEEERKG